MTLCSTYYSTGYLELCFSDLNVHMLHLRVLLQFRFRLCGSDFGPASESKSCSVVSTSLQPHGLQSTESSRPEYWSGQPFPFLGYLPNPGMELGSPALQVDSLPAEPQGNPKNIEVGSLFLLQHIFPIQESNHLHCRWILYQLSYQGSPEVGTRLLYFS